LGIKVALGFFSTHLQWIDSSQNTQPTSASAQWYEEFCGLCHGLDFGNGVLKPQTEQEGAEGK